MKTEEQSPLVAAAIGLDAELRRFEQLAESVQRASLNSEKNLGRASRTLKELGQVGQAVHDRLTDMVTAIAGVREKQEALMGRVQKKSEELQHRSNELEGLLSEYQLVGQHAKELKESIESLSARTKTDAAASVAFYAPQEFDGKFGQLIEEAKRLFDRAEASDFPEVAHQVDGLHQQLQAVRNKLNLLQKNVPQA